MCVCVMVLCVCVLVLPVRSLNTHKADTLKWFIDEISVCLHESFAVCVCVQETHLKSLSADRVYTIHLSFIWRHICASVCIFLILLWHQQC